VPAFRSPALCRFLSAFVGCIRLFARHNQGMDITDKYIPREYLALKINYCKKQLAELPEVKVYICHTVNGKESKRYYVGNHRYSANTPAGRKMHAILLLRDEIERNLDIYESLWNSLFKGSPLPECLPCQALRTLAVDYNKRVILNKDFFDNLKADANTKHAKSHNYFFNGIYYRSAAEREIAVFYTEMGIPFKYEPEISLIGLPYTINPDFVLYIKELDTCKFHEHFGMKNSSNYLRITKLKYCNYTDAGLVPEVDILFTHDTEDMPFCISNLTHKLNTAIAITANGTLPTR
jgi:hypothetical protein